MLTRPQNTRLPTCHHNQPAAVMVGCVAYVVAKLDGLDVRFSEVEQVGL
jgi:hypothetical protein